MSTAIPLQDQEQGEWEMKKEGRRDEGLWATLSSELIDTVWDMAVTGPEARPYRSSTSHYCRLSQGLVAPRQGLCGLMHYSSQKQLGRQHVTIKMPFRPFTSDRRTFTLWLLQPGHFPLCTKCVTQGATLLVASFSTTDSTDCPLP